MHKFKVGQKVVRTVDYISDNPKWKGKRLKKGDIHSVRALHYDSTDGRPFILLEGIHNPVSGSGVEFGYDVNYFAPLIEPATGFVEVSFSKVVETEPKICAS